MQPITIHIPNELLTPSECRHYEGVANIGIVKSGPDVYDFKKPVSWSLDITNTGGALLVSGTAEGIGTVSCARCLEPAEVELEGEIEGYFILSASSSVKEELEEDEFEVLGDDKEIDLAPLIQAALILELPQIPLCRRDCKGICPRCGSNLNVSDCRCNDGNDLGPDGPANPFAILKDYDFGE